MDQRRFDAMSMVVALEQTRRTALRRVIGGGLAALLTTAGLEPAADAAAVPQAV
jgi:hypothetical protein